MVEYRITYLFRPRGEKKLGGMALSEEQQASIMAMALGTPTINHPLGDMVTFYKLEKVSYADLEKPKKRGKK